MSVAVAGHAIGLLLAPRPSRARLGLTGGEPLAAASLLRSCIEAARLATPADTNLRIAVSTNGTLLSGELARFLASHDVELQISFDGEGQEGRAAGTRPAVEAAIRRAAAADPGWFARRVRVALTIVPDALARLADSVDAVLALGVGDVVLSPARGLRWPEPEEVEAALERELLRLASAGRTSPREDGLHPVALLREPAPRSWPPDGTPFCAAGSPSSFAVDPDGIAWACPSLTGSMQAFPPEGAELAAALRLGDIRDPGFPERLARAPSLAAARRVLTHRLAKRSRLAECRSCPQVSVCLPCPAAAAREDGPFDPGLVPAPMCALTRAAARTRASLATRRPDCT
jgi:MoaA/NifB/PqqE/SkfB family radical SAM enzyme